MIVNIHYAKTHLSKLLERVRRGSEITIAKAGKPVAKLVPLAPSTPRTPGGFAFRIGNEFFEPLPEDDLRSWE
ncbi:MAG: type II toxin-antitoxin system Phd/YefM family antitoxin [Gemmatimonadaceae bacterium]